MIEVLDAWLSLQITQNSLNTWAAFERVLKTEFIPVDYERYLMSELKKCKQTESGAPNVETFHRLIHSNPERSKMEKWITVLMISRKV